MATSVYDFFASPIKLDQAVPANARDELYALCDDPMSAPVKLINENLRFADTEGRNIRDCFIENSGFLVVGVLGLQGTGKSSVANLMANNLSSTKFPITEGPFRVQTVDSLIEGYPCTSAGIDLYITQDRVIILDSQPILSWALSDLHQQQAQGEESASGRWSIDGFAEMTSLQIISFLFSVCHVVVCVQDSLSNPDLLRLIDRAASLKPLILTDDLLTASHLTGVSRAPVEPRKTAEAKQGDLAKANHRFEKSDTEKSEDVVGVEVDDEMASSGAPASDETGLGQTPSAVVVVTGKDRQENQEIQEVQKRTSIAPESRFARFDEMAEQQAEVRALVQGLQRLTDYSASLVHVYNTAPADVFLSDKVDARLNAYRRLLSNAFPGRLSLATYSSIGSNILARYAANRRARQASSDSGKRVAAGEDVDFSATNKSFTEDPISCTETSMRVSEAEIVADCCDELESVRLKCLASAATTDQLQPQPHGHKLSSAIICNNNKTTVETFFEDDRLPDGGDAGGAGEDVSIQLNAFNRQVLDTRRAFFDREKALTNPRLFLLPATNEKGEVPFGCPSYLECAYLLQEAVLSTPRQQMQPNLTESVWFEFARQTWQLISSSPLINDYYRLLMNNA